MQNQPWLTRFQQAFTNQGGTKSLGSSFCLKSRWFCFGSRGPIGLVSVSKNQLNSSPIDELGCWCLQSWWSQAMLQHEEEEVSIATLRASPTRHHQSEQFSGILTNQYLPGPYLKSRGTEGGMGKTKAQNGTQTASYYNNTL